MHNAVENTYALAEHLASTSHAPYPNQARINFVLGVRIGLAITLWRPSIAHVYMESMKHTLIAVGSTHQDLAAFERICIEAILDRDMLTLPTLLEHN